MTEQDQVNKLATSKRASRVMRRSKRSKRHSILLLVTICACSGCGASIGVRIGAYDDSPPVGIYPATRGDLGLIAYAVIMPFRDPYSTRFPPDAQDGLVYVFLPISIVDLPLAIAADTVFLPYDIYNSRKQDQSDDE